MTYSFLMIGQSNMAGRGFIKDVKQIYDEKIKMLRNGRWKNMYEPINYDNPNAGISLAASFAATWRLDNNADEIGLIPCAEGGTSLEDWHIDGTLFKNAICQAQLAQSSSKLSGILWHQGENNCYPAAAHQQYEQKLTKIIDTLRDKLNMPEVPLIVGALGDFLPNGLFGKYFKLYREVNSAIQNYAFITKHCYYVSAQGLTSNPDQLHFDALSLRKLGIRYYEAFSKRQHILEPLINEETILNTINTKELNNAEKKAILDIEFSSGKISMDSYQIQTSALSSKQ